MSFEKAMKSDSKREKISHSVCVGGPMTLHTIDGVIRRVRPIVLTDDDPAGWVIKARGKEYTPQRKFTMSLLGYCEKDRTYSYDRLKYPMIREDFVETPDGKNRNTENRGKSGYRRASWDEALSPRRPRDQAPAQDLRQGDHHRLHLVPPLLGPRRL